MSLFEERTRILSALSDYERLSVLANLWPSLPSCIQGLTVQAAACLMDLDLPTADSELAIIMAGWPTLSATDRRMLSYAASLGSEETLDPDTET